MEGLRCAVCKERFYVGQYVRLIGDATVTNEKHRVSYNFNINEEGEQEICAIHPKCGLVVLHFDKDGEGRSIALFDPTQYDGTANRTTTWANTMGQTPKGVRDKGETYALLSIL